MGLHTVSGLYCQTAFCGANWGSSADTLVRGKGLFPTQKNLAGSGGTGIPFWNRTVCKAIPLPEALPPMWPLGWRWFTEHENKGRLAAPCCSLGYWRVLVLPIILRELGNPYLFWVMIIGVCYIIVCSADFLKQARASLKLKFEIFLPRLLGKTLINAKVPGSSIIWHYCKVFIAALQKQMVFK